MIKRFNRKPWRKRTKPRKRWVALPDHSDSFIASGSFASIDARALARPRRSKRVRRYYARLLTRLEQLQGRLAVRNFYASLKTFPGAFRLGICHLNRS